MVSNVILVIQGLVGLCIFYLYDCCDDGVVDSTFARVLEFS